jgi:starch phosphorylase
MRPSYIPRHYYERSDAVRRVVDAISSGRFSPREPGLFASIRSSLLDQGDYYFHLADFEAYVDAQQRVSEDYAVPPQWWRKSILNVARMGKFSSDRTIREYARDIWQITAIER